jgi:hypothetical protein
MAEQEPHDPKAAAPGEPAPEPAGGSSEHGPVETAPTEGLGQSEATPTAEPATVTWESFDAVLQAFAAERGVGAGTYWGESPGEIDGRFAGWSNASGWRCTLQLVRPPEENVVVLIAQGPPLPGGRSRAMMLGVFPPEFERDTLHAALEVGYALGETWGPAEEPFEPASPPPPDSEPAPTP